MFDIHTLQLYGTNCRLNITEKQTKGPENIAVETIKVKYRGNKRTEKK